MKKVSTILLSATALAAGCWYAGVSGWFRGSNADARDGGTPTALVEKRDVEFSVSVNGDVTPQFQLEVKPEVGGKIKELYVQAGDSVKEGQVLVEIDDRDILSERESAKTEIEGARVQVTKITRNFERAKELFKQKLITNEEFDNMESELALAKNSMERADRKLQIVEDKLRKTKVTAPGDGTVLTAPVIEGQVVIAAASVNSGTTLMTIANLERLIVACHVNQVDFSRIKPGQKVTLRAESLKDVELDATVFFIAPLATVRNNVKGFTVQAVIEKPVAALRPGMTVKVNIPVAHADQTLAVPVSAVFRSEGNKRVVFVQNGGITEKREVKIGVSNIDHAEVLTGVSEGEKILLVNPERAAKKRS